LAGGVAQINVGAATEAELKEKESAHRRRAARGPRAAVEEGVVAGGGVAYIRALKALKRRRQSQARRRRSRGP